MSQNSQPNSFTVAASSPSRKISGKIATEAITEETITTTVLSATTAANAVTSSTVEREMKDIGSKLRELCHKTAETNV